MTSGLLGLVLVALVMSVAGSFAPVFCAEAFVGVVAAGHPAGHAVAVALAAAAGQTAGKTMVLLAARSASGRCAPAGWVVPGGRLLARSGPRRSAATGARGARASAVATAVRVPVRALAWAHARAARAVDGPAARPVVLLSGAVGLPPLLAVTLYASGSPMRVRAFVAWCGSGRAVRMLAVAGAAWAAAGTG